MEKSKKIYLAGGCFWGTQHFMRQIRGVTATRVGYANSRIAEPDYRSVCSGQTGAAEAVEVCYLPNVVSLGRLLQLFFMSFDPTQTDRQGNDVGTQYRSGIYYTDQTDFPEIQAAIEAERGEVRGKVVTEVAPLANFYPAEEYHQNYLVNNPGGYCHVRPELIELAKKAPTYPKESEYAIEQRLSPLQYAVTRLNLTEPPFNNEYNREFRPGIYVDIITGEPLFVSTDKFESGCGWPAFSRPISSSLIEELRDLTHGMDRTEVRSKRGDTHLGHVFDDGPAELGGKRYCINSASLRFVPREEMEQQGYGEYIRLVD